LSHVIRLAACVFLAVASSFVVAGTFSPRMVHSGVGQGQYPDAYLEKIAASGVDSVIVNITDPLTGTYAGGTEDLSSLITRAAKKGVGIYAYADFPVLSEKLHPAESGAREWYDKIYGGIVKNHPGLKGLIFVGESVAFPYCDHRPTHHWWRPCKDGACSVGFNPVPDWADWLKLVKDVTRQYDPKVDLVFWTYNWFRKPEKDRLALLELLPTDISLLVTFDMGDHKTRKCGIDMTVDDYSITIPGPGSTFASEAPVAKRRGIRLYSMTNTGGRTWDFGLLPYEPVPWRWKARFEAIREAHDRYGLCGLMESHHYGFTPNPMSRLGTRILAPDYRPADFEKIIREIAVEECGEACADAVMAAWKDWSDAFEWHSSYWNDQYTVYRNGPVYPFCLPGAKIPDPLHPVYEFHDGIQHGNGWKYTLTTFDFEKDRLDGDEELATRELELLDRGVARLKGLKDAAKQWAIGSFMAATIRTSRNAKRYYRAGLAKDARRMLEILDDEERNVRSCFDWVDVDPQIGWEPTMGRVVARDTLEWKLRQLQSARREAAAVMPELTVGILSDLHIEGAGPSEKLSAFERALVYFRDSRVDAVVLAGDLADYGLVSELENLAGAWYRIFPEDRRPDGAKVEKIFVYGDHDATFWKIKSVYWGGEWEGEERSAKWADAIARDPAAAWEKCFREPYRPLFVKTVKGYDFLCAHWQEDGKGRPVKDIPGAADFIRTEGAKRAGTKPFFYVQHRHPKGTLFGDWVVADNGSVTPALAAFPNVVSLSGHAHQPLSDERNVWQGAFTAVGTATLDYVGGRHYAQNLAPFVLGGSHDAPQPRLNAKLSKQGLVMRVYTDRIDFERRDFVWGESMGPDWSLPLPLGRAKPYDYATRAAQFVAPEFAAEAKATFEERDGKTVDDKPMRRVVVTFPCANATKTRVYRYEITAWQEDEDLRLPVASKMVLAPDHHLPPARTGLPGEAHFALSELPTNAHVRFEVTPVDCFNHRGKPLVTADTWIHEE